MSFKAFLSAYTECLVWSEAEDNGENFDNRDGEFSHPALTAIESDCRDFYDSYDSTWQSALSDAQAGHDFCLTRNGHGTGFWDRGLGALGEELSKACKPYGTQNLYRGDDGNLYVG